MKSLAELRACATLSQSAVLEVIVKKSSTGDVDACVMTLLHQLFIAEEVVEKGNISFYKEVLEFCLNAFLQYRTRTQAEIENFPTQIDYLYASMPSKAAYEVIENIKRVLQASEKSRLDQENIIPKGLPPLLVPQKSAMRARVGAGRGLSIRIDNDNKKAFQRN